jgi:taurine-pyruvate aminotransferase
MGAYLMERLKELEAFPIVGNIRGQGLLAGVELVEDKQSKMPLQESRLAQIVASAREEGVIIGRMTRSVPGYNNVLYMAPPLIIDKYGIDRIIDALRNALRRQV